MRQLWVALCGAASDEGSWMAAVRSDMEWCSTTKTFGPLKDATIEPWNTLLKHPASELSLDYACWETVPGEQQPCDEERQHTTAYETTTLRRRRDEHASEEEMLPFPCYQCGRSFARVGDLHLHAF